MNMDITAPDTKFLTPSFYTVVFWICEILVLISGTAMAFSVAQTGPWQLFLIVGIIVFVSLILRVAFELVLVFFEQLRVARQIREKVHTALKINGLGVDAAEAMSKELPRIRAAIVDLKMEIGELKKMGIHTASSNVQEEDPDVQVSDSGVTEMSCPLCGATISVPVGVQKGQHIRCSRCNGKFAF